VNWYIIKKKLPIVINKEEKRAFG